MSTAAGGADVRTHRLPTGQGDARVVWHPSTAPGGPWARLVLSHGASGGLDAVDLALAAARLPAVGVEVAMIEQPWRVAGRSVAPAPARLDEAFTAVVEQCAQHSAWLPLPLVLGGRSAGARVACRTARRLGAAGVLALAFPLHPPGRPDRSRRAELVDTGVPTLVVQGQRDTFGSAAEVTAALDPAPDRPDRPEAPIEVVEVPAADHGFAVRVRDGGERARAAGLDLAMARVARWLCAVTGRLGAGNSPGNSPGNS